jgi:hypothetical protein
MTSDRQTLLGEANASAKRNLIKLKRTRSVCTEKERKRERKREKTEKTIFLFF